MSQSDDAREQAIERGIKAIHKVSEQEFPEIVAAVIDASGLLEALAEKDALVNPLRCVCRFPPNHRIHVPGKQAHR